MEIEKYSKQLEITTEAAKLLLTVFSGIGFAYFHRLFLFNKSRLLQNAIFTFLGISLIYWNYGTGVIYSLINILAQWLIFHLIGTGGFSAAFSFFFNSTFLVVGYYATMTDGYDITWTMPHCILTLRLIGLAFDVYDGHKDQKTVAADQEAFKVTDIPSLIEVTGFCYFYPTFFVGPQNSLRLYRDMLDGKLSDVPEKPPNSLIPALKRYICGVLVLGAHTVINSQFPNPIEFDANYIQEHGVLWLVFCVMVRAYVFFSQYIGIWMINEAACIYCGLGYKVEKDKISWDGMRNVRCVKFFTASCYQDMIESFNVNTNRWVFRYVFKRLRFLNNKSISHLSTLLFLAIWHGFHEGYFFTFLFEYLVMKAERPAREQLNRFKFIQAWKKSSFWWLYQVCGWIYVKICVGYCILAFYALKWPKFLHLFNSMYWYGHVFYFMMYLATMVLNVSTSKSIKTEKN